MVIRYKANRSDIWHFYWHTWRHSIRIIPWGKIARVAPVGERIYILGNNGNGFAIPPGAFGTDTERAEFLQCATQWWSAARRLNPAASTDEPAAR
jgi:hypothetical protein